MKSVDVLLLAAGLGTRLGDLTNTCPKCLAPISGKPLLGHWLEILGGCPYVKSVIVNTHYMADMVRFYLDQPKFKGWVFESYEKNLLGTAGTIRANRDLFGKNNSVLVIHADNFSIFEINSFIEYHQKSQNECGLTMMTFETDDPSSCGIVEVDSRGIVSNFFEKSSQYHGLLANGAVYLMNPKVLQIIYDSPLITDISLDLLPKLVGEIATWKNGGVHIDIGTPEIY